MTVKAKLSDLKISARKVRLVADLIRDKSSVNEAIKVLTNESKRAALPLIKLLNSVIANATNNNGMDAQKLKITSIRVDEGPTLKRFRPRAHGRAFQILKRTSHVTVVVEEHQGGNY